MSKELTITFDPDAAGALRYIAERINGKHSDVVRHALSLYGFIVEEQLTSGHDLALLDGSDVSKIIVVPGISLRDSSGETAKRDRASPLQVFLSHLSDDKEAVRELHRRLKEDGFSPWLDEEDLEPGAPWDGEIQDAIHRADIVLVCLSKKWQKRDEAYFFKEVKEALERAKRKRWGVTYLITVRLEPCEIPAPLNQHHYADLFNESGYEKLRDALLGKSEAPARSTRRK